ncbi:MAG: hypothetical protein KC800_26515 [Candidatus Eremiobacteraeota bacterium]|nr:hypothetical protein [Candidatus Eremiobacteraeota bacterium]
MKNNQTVNIQASSEARDFWTARLSECPHERLREALKFQPLTVAKGSAPSTRKVVAPVKRNEPQLDWKDKSPLQIRVIVWKREVTALVRTAFTFLAGFLGYLVSQPPTT